MPRHRQALTCFFGLSDEHWPARRPGPAWALVLLALTLLALAPGSAAAAGANCHDSAVTVTDTTEHITLASCLWVLEDPSHQKQLEDVLAIGQGEGGFQKHHSGALNFGYTESAYWVHFDLRYEGSRDIRDYVLELVLPLVDEVDLYLLNDGVVTAERHFRYDTGWTQRDLAVPNPNFHLELQRGETVTAYLRVFTRNTFRLPLHLWDAEAYAEEVALTELIHGAFLGAMLAIFAFNLFVTLVVREKGYVYYMLYLLFGTLFILTEQVHGQQLFGYQVPLLDKDFLHIWIILAWIGAILMARDLLETRTQAPGLDHLLTLALYGTVATLVLSLFIRYHVSMQWTVIGSVVLVVLMLFASYQAWSMRIPSASTYLVSWSVVLASVGLYAFAVMGYLPVNNFTAHAPQLGFASQVVLLSFAMAKRIKMVQEEALRWNQSAVSNLQRYRSLFDNAIEGIFQISRHSRFIEANPALARMLGYESVQELLTESPNALEACIASAAVRDRVRAQLQASGQLKGMEVAYIDRQGQECWATISLRTVYDSEGEPTHLEGAFVDVTERKHREEVERERENERLEKEIARSSAASKSQFLANMSHEIRTPLAAIIGYGETLMEPDLSEEQKRNSAQTVVRSGRHLLDLINDILDHSKIDANKLDVEILTVNLLELLEDVRAFFAPRAEEKGVDFRIVCEYPLPEMIQTDPTRLRQIFINLCANALKFTERGSIHVTVRCDRHQQRLVATVVDTGIGMKPEQLDRLFDPFAQGSSAIARQYGGTGLGLSISRRLCELLGGTVQVRSEYGEGSEFEITIDTGPLEDIRFIRDATEVVSRRQQLPLVAVPRLKGRILCAEDNEVNRNLVNLLVRRTGAEVVHVGNGAEALETGLHGGFDLILMDIQMPLMNGRDATRALREAGVNTPVVALTANVMVEDVRDYREAGCTDFLAKPIDKLRFYEVLARYLPAANYELQGVGEPADPPGEARLQGTVLVAEDPSGGGSGLRANLEGSGVEVIPAATGAQAVQLAMAKTVHLLLMDSQLPELSAAEATRLLRQTGFRRPIIAVSADDQQDRDALTAAGCDTVLARPVTAERIRQLLEKHLPAADSGPAAPEEPEDAALAALIQQFLDALPGRLAAMREAVHQSRWDELRVHAHQLKGSAGAMGYPLMTECAGMLEQALRQSDTDQAQATLASLEEMIQQALGTRVRQ